MRAGAGLHRHEAWQLLRHQPRELRNGPVRRRFVQPEQFFVRSTPMMPTLSMEALSFSLGFGTASLAHCYAAKGERYPPQLHSGLPVAVRYFRPAPAGGQARPGVCLQTDQPSQPAQRCHVPVRAAICIPSGSSGVEAVKPGRTAASVAKRCPSMPRVSMTNRPRSFCQLASCRPASCLMTGVAGS